MKILDTILLAILVVCCSDLIYLYFAGTWYDPFRGIEIIELIVLSLIIIISSIRIVVRLLDF